MKIYGFDVFYLPRETANLDEILNEDPLNKYRNAYPLEMYLSNISGFEGEGDLLTKFGVEIRDTATFIVSKRRWEQAVAKKGTTLQLDTRPAEGDIIFFPLTKSFFEIRRVETRDPFFQVGKLYVYKLECELMQYSSESIETGIQGIDNLPAEKSLDVGSYEVLLEDGSDMLLEYFTPARLILEDFDITQIDKTSQNENFKAEIDILDFSERNPFGEIDA